MSTPQDAIATAMAIPASRGLKWCVDGLRLWRRAPFKFFFMYLVVVIVTALIESVPWVGSWTLHIFELGMLQYGILLGLDALANGQRLRWAHLFGCFRRGRFWGSLGLVALCGAVEFGIVQLVVWAVYGQAGVDLMWLGQRWTHKALIGPQLQEIASLPGTIIAMFLMLAPCLLLFQNRSPWRALTESIRTVIRYPAPFATFLAVNLVVVLVGSSTRWLIPLSLILGLPWMTACSYAVWRDLTDALPSTVAKG